MNHCSSQSSLYVNLSTDTKKACSFANDMGILTEPSKQIKGKATNPGATWAHSTVRVEVPLSHYVS